MLDTISGGYGPVLWGHTQLQGHHSTSAFHKHIKSPPHTSFATWTNETPEKKIILGREGEVITPFTTWNMLERVCTN